MVITVTDKARETLKELLSSNSDDPEVSLRLVAKPTGQFGLALDKEAEGDQVVEQEGAKVLLIGHELANILGGTTLDVQDTSDGPKLSISQPEEGGR
jgi:Fe-S cluster assembly iron-binding protein IscA